MKTKQKTAFNPANSKGFAPNSANKAKRPDRPAAAQPEAADLVAAKQSGAMQVRETALATAGKGAKALQVLAEQRERVKDTLKNEIIRLTDSDLFFAELMSEVAAELPQNEAQLDFFGCYSVEELILPEVRPLKAIAAAEVK